MNPSPPRPRNLHPLLAFLLVTCAAGWHGCGSESDHAPKPGPELPTASVIVQTAEVHSFPTTETVVGTIQATRQAVLAAKINARIESLPVVLGQKVAAGESLVHLDDAESAARLNQARAALIQAERDWNRINTLYEAQAATRAEQETSETRFRLVQAEALEAEAQFRQVQVTAPFDGVVTKKWVEVGDLASPGKPLLSLQDPSRWQLDANVPSSLAPHLRQGDRLAVRLEGTNGHFDGILREISPAADPISRTLRVQLELPPKPDWFSGQFARLIVPLGEAPSMRLPNAAIVRRGQLEMVFVVNEGRAAMRLVKTGKQFEDSTEILSGLTAGEAVVIEGAARLKDGQPVALK